MGEDWYRMQGIDVVDVDRGGQLTYHGPGQLVGYPIMRVDDVMAYVRTMEQAIVAALADEGVPAPRGRSDDGRDFIGVWIGGAQDRLDRRAPLARRDDARLRGQRRQRPAALRVGRALRAARRAHDLDHARARPTASTCRCFRKRMAFRFAEALGRRQRLVSAARLEAAIGAAPVPA